MIANGRSEANDPQTEASQPTGPRRSMAIIPYSPPDDGTEETLKTITADDLKAFHRRCSPAGNCISAVVGADRCRDAEARPGQAIGNLPEKASLTPVARPMTLEAGSGGTLRICADRRPACSIPASPARIRTSSPPW